MKIVAALNERQKDVAQWRVGSKEERERGKKRKDRKKERGKEGNKEGKDRRKE